MFLNGTFDAISNASRTNPCIRPPPQRHTIGGGGGGKGGQCPPINGFSLVNLPPSNRGLGARFGPKLLKIRRRMRLFREIFQVFQKIGA